MKKIVLTLMVFCSIALYAQNSTSNDEIKPIKIGERFRDLVVPDTSGVNVKLSDYCGKGYYTLIEFGASWCKPCQKDAPILKGIYDKYHPYGLILISVFIDEKKESWQNFINKYAINWIHLSELIPSLDTKANKTYVLTQVPFYIIVDPQGTVIYQRTGRLTAENTLVPKLKELYGF